MNIKPIKTEKDYKQALSQIDKLWDAKVNSPEADILNILPILVEDYKDNNFKIYPPNPIEAIKFRMEQLGLNNSDIAKYPVFNSFPMIRGRKFIISLLEQTQKRTKIIDLHLVFLVEGGELQFPNRNFCVDWGWYDI